MSRYSILIDVSRPETLQHTINWKEDLDRKVSMADGSPIPCVLLANKVLLLLLFF